MPRSVDGGGRARRSIWESLSSAPARLIFRPSASPSQPSRSASAMRAVVAVLELVPDLFRGAKESVAH